MNYIMSETINDLSELLEDVWRYEAIGDIPSKIQTHLTISRGCITRLDFESALENLYTALNHFAEFEDANLEVELKAEIGRVLIRAGAVKASQAYLEEALQIAESIQLPLWQARLLSDLSSVYTYLDQNQTALTSAQQSRRIYRLHGDLRGEAEASLREGTARSNFSEHDAAYRCFEFSAESAQEANDIPLQAQAWIFLGEAYLHVERNEDARQSFNMALEALQEVGSHPLMVDCYRGLSSVHKAFEQWQKAINHLETSYLMDQTIQNQMIARRVEYLETAYRVERKHLENEAIQSLEYTDKNSRRDDLGFISSLERLATRDSITGLYNQQHMIGLVEGELARTTRYHRPLSLLLIEIDQYDDVKRLHGEVTAKSVLIAVANRLASTLRRNDLLGCHKVHHFLAVLPETPASKALQAAERLRAVVSAGPMVTTHGDLDVSISIGLASATGKQEEQVGILITQAHSALQAALRSGGNQSQIFIPS